MKNLLYILFVYFLCATTFAQDIFIERTDVDSSRSGFVTATYNFSFKVKLKNVRNCTGISFVLRYNQTEYVKFSNYRTLPFSRSGSVFVYPFYNPIDGYERIFTGILNGDTVGGVGETNPEAIEFEFSVGANAPENTFVEFFFEDAEAVVSDSSSGKIIKLKSNTVLYNIHGFVNVWPGDANNDGIVNINDVSVVALYLGYGANKSNFRSFQRKNASTDWFAQSCLGWDSLAITYADCDGDGEVTINDMLIIPLNFGKTHVNRTHYSAENSLTQFNEIHLKELVRVPYSIECEEPIVGFISEMPTNQIFINVKEIFPLNSFNDDIFTVVVNNEQTKYFLSGSSQHNPLNNRIFAYSNQQNVLIGRGITKQGKIVAAKLVPQNLLSKADEMLILENLEGIKDFPLKIKIFDILGEEKYYTQIYSFTELQNSLENLPRGLYFIQLQSNCKLILIKHFSNN